METWRHEGQVFRQLSIECSPWLDGMAAACLLGFRVDSLVVSGYCWGASRPARVSLLEGIMRSVAELVKKADCDRWRKCLKEKTISQTDTKTSESTASKVPRQTYKPWASHDRATNCRTDLQAMSWTVLDGLGRSDGAGVFVSRTGGDEADVGGGVMPLEA